jgi:hypothetical protein
LLLAPIRFEQVSAALCKDDRAVVRAEWTCAQQTFLFEVALGFACVLAAVMEIALGDDAKRANGGEHPAFGAVDLVNTLALPNQFALMAARQVEILHEHVAQVVFLVSVAFPGATATAAGPIPRVVPIAVLNRSTVMPVPHDPVPLFWKERPRLTCTRGSPRLEYGKRMPPVQSIIWWCRVLSCGVGSRRCRFRLIERNQRATLEPAFERLHKQYSERCVQYGVH